MKINQRKMIQDKESIEQLFKELVNNHKNYLQTLASFNINLNYNLDSVLNEYKNNNFEKIFSNDEIAQFEYESSLDQEKYIEEYIVRKGLKKNRKIEKSWNDLNNSYNKLGLTMDLKDDFTLEIEYASFEDTPFKDFILKDCKDFILRCEKYDSNKMLDTPYKIQRELNRLLSLSGYERDINGDHWNSGYDRRCQEEMGHDNKDFYRIVEVIEYKIDKWVE